MIEGSIRIRRGLAGAREVRRRAEARRKKGASGWSDYPLSCGIRGLALSTAWRMVRLLMATPEWLAPMAATLTQDRFSGPEWLFERKFDGIRLLAYKQGEDVRLYSRNRLLQDLPAIARAI